VPTANAVPAPASGSSLRTNPIVRPVKLALEGIIHMALHTDQPATRTNSQIAFYHWVRSKAITVSSHG
jgi:hypothetical protein